MGRARTQAAAFSLVLFAVAWPAFAGLPAELPPFETPPLLDAQAILLPQFQAGPNFVVRRQAPVRGGLDQFTIDSDYGVFTADGAAALVQRVAEIDAIARLREVSRSEEYKKALARAATGPLKVAQSVVEHPVDTAGGIAKGVWKTLNGFGQKAKEVGQGRRQSEYEDSLPEDLIGFSSTKRDIALKLGVDPYSTNRELQAELKKVAWAAYGGKMTIAGALMPVGGVAGLAIKSVNASGQALTALRELDPSDLRLRNLKILLALGIERGLANSFLGNPALSPTHQTIIVDCLQQLRVVAGAEKFIRLAAASDDEGDALRYQRSAQLLALINRGQPIEALSSYHGLPLALTRAGALVAPLDWDYAYWNREAARFAASLRDGRIGDLRFKSAHIYLTGVASPAALSAAALQRIVLTQRALPGPLK